MGQAGNADIRISNAERDEAVSTLGAHLSTGRLELAEYEERCERAVAARTRGEIEALFTDLPAPHPDLSSAAVPAQLVRKAGELARKGTGRSKEVDETPASAAFGAVAGISFVLGIPAATILTIFLGLWWVFIPVGVVLIVAGACADATKKPKSGT